MITEISFMLVIVSAVIHPIWNMLLKRSSDKFIFYLNIHLLFTFLFSFILFLYPIQNMRMSGWVLVLFSAAAHFFYQAFLCRAYELGDLSLTYPIIRSSPIFVLLLALVFLREVPSAAAVVGIIIVIIGAQLINQKGFNLKEFLAPFQPSHKKAIVAAALTAFFSACYSAVDKKGVLEVEPVLFFYLFFAISGFMFLGYLMTQPQRRTRYFKSLNTDKFRVGIAALLEFASYILILYAFRISKVAYIIALRQISVVFGVLYGILFLKERYGKVRLAGSAIMFIGIFLITVFG